MLSKVRSLWTWFLMLVCHVNMAARPGRCDFKCSLEEFQGLIYSGAYFLSIAIHSYTGNYRCYDQIVQSVLICCIFNL